jgi:hypothetical protein
LLPRVSVFDDVLLDGLLVVLRLGPILVSNHVPPKPREGIAGLGHHLVVPAAKLPPQVENGLRKRILDHLAPLLGEEAAIVLAMFAGELFDLFGFHVEIGSGRLPRKPRRPGLRNVQQHRLQFGGEHGNASGRDGNERCDYMFSKAQNGKCK